jgi:hypothetical protein
MSKKILVDASALGDLLAALNGPAHLIRELVATRRVSLMAGTPSSIDVLRNDWQEGKEAPGFGDWVVKGVESGTYLYISRHGKPGSIHIKADTEGFVVDVWHADEVNPEVISTLAVPYEDLAPVEEPPEYTCTCGGHEFTLVVNQLVDVQFEPGDHTVTDGPRGDMEWHEGTEAICKSCGRTATLGELKTQGSGS